MVNSPIIDPLQSLGLAAGLDVPPDPRAQLAGLSQHEIDDLLDIEMELEARKTEALRIYEPSEFQERFHACRAKERLIQAGNQVGKSLAAFVEDARAVTGQDPHDKYPKKNGVLVCLGLDESHIGRVIHKYLFRSGQFFMIRDETTGEWRSWKPWLPSDLARIEERKEAPPLIPPRFIKNNGIAWKKAGKKVFEIAELTNGWVIYAMSSKGEPAAGFQADCVHIDEDIERPEWYDEMIARLTMRNGKIWWSALPLAKNDALINLTERAEDEKDDEHPSTVVFRATIWDNPYMPEEARQENVKRWQAKGDEEYRKRALGELVHDAYLMYPQFSPQIHSAIRHLTPEEEEAERAGAKIRTLVQRIMTERLGEPPRDWCRYAWVDPGWTVCAVTLWAVPPPEIGDQVVCYRELYLRNANATAFGDAFARACHDVHFQAFGIDKHGGRLRDIGSGISPERQYEDALKSHGIFSHETENRFLAGCDDIEGRELKLREWLTIRAGGTPKFLYVPQLCPNLEKEFRRFKRKRTPDGYTLDEGQRRANTHAIETCEYAAAHGLKYVKPEPILVYNSYVDQILKARQQRTLQSLRSQAGRRDQAIQLAATGVPL